MKIIKKCIRGVIPIVTPQGHDFYRAEGLPATIKGATAMARVRNAWQENAPEV